MACNVGVKKSVGDNATIQVMVTVDVEKCDGENKVISELKIIFNLYVKSIMSAWERNIFVETKLLKTQCY